MIDLSKYPSNVIYYNGYPFPVVKNKLALDVLKIVRHFVEDRCLTGTETEPKNPSPHH